QAQAGNTGVNVAQAEANLAQAEEEIRGGTAYYPGTVIPMPPAERRRRALLAAGARPEDIGELPSGPLDVEGRRRLAQSAGGGAIGAAAGIQVIDNALRPGGMPNLRPGAPGLDELPNVFRS